MPKKKGKKIHCKADEDSSCCYTKRPITASDFTKLRQGRKRNG